MATPGMPDREEPWQRGLWIGLSAYRLIVFVWMVVLAAISAAFDARRESGRLLANESDVTSWLAPLPIPVG